ncbi:MAG TPA: PDZ domain-containing protein [Sorangium sp.]|nr:PDZ domain-containing protein [Sorangium sp.]
MKLWRDGKLLERTATLDRLEDDPPNPRATQKPTAPASKHGHELGIQLEDSPAGVRIVRLMRPNRELRPGDLLVSVNRRPVRDTANVKDALAHTKNNTALLQVRRGQRQRYVAIPLK